MALEFNASNKTYVDCGNDSSLNVYSQHTIVVRFVALDIPSPEGWLVCRRILGSYKGFGINYHDTKTIDFYCGTGNHFESSAIDLNTFYTAIQMFDGSTLKGYLNNVSQGSISASCVSTDANFIIGSDSYNCPRYIFPGIIHEIRVYNRCITDTEREIITFSQGSDNIVDGLVGWWRFDEKPEGESATGTNSIIDLSGHGNHGTPTNNPIYHSGNLRIIKPPIIR